MQKAMKYFRNFSWITGPLWEETFCFYIQVSNAERCVEQSCSYDKSRSVEMDMMHL